MTFICSCYEPYPAPSIQGNTPVLVVDAFVNSGDGSASITLSYAAPLAAADSFAYINHAVVKIIAESGAEFAANFDSAGMYSANGLHLNTDDQYKLTIVIDERTYESAFVPVLQTPAIDTMTWSINNDDLDIGVSTHDPQNNSRYYRWQYVETWQYHSRFLAPYVVKNDSVWLRTPEEDISVCWKTETGRNISVYSTNYLDEDIVSNFTLTKIPLNSLKLTSRYSTLVRQQVLTQEAYQYWKKLKETSESLGTLFDPLPAAVKGNIRSVTDPDENVIGFFSVGSVSEKRIYINSSEVEGYITYQYPACTIDKIVCDTSNGGTWYTNKPRIHISDPDGVVGQVTGDGGVIGYFVTRSVCTDCRKSGTGNTKRPSFWKD